MKELEIGSSEYYDEMNTVVTALLKGENNPTAIARSLGMPRKKVLDYMDEWSKIARNRPDIAERAMETLTNMDRHYDMIVKEYWDILSNELDNKVRATVLKNLADIEVKRHETLQKAGLFDDSGIADQLAEMEETAEAIKNLLSSVASKYPETKIFIMEGISNIFGKGVSIPTGETLPGEISA